MRRTKFKDIESGFLSSSPVKPFDVRKLICLALLWHNVANDAIGAYLPTPAFIDRRAWNMTTLWLYPCPDEVANSRYRSSTMSAGRPGRSAGRPQRYFRPFIWMHTPVLYVRWSFESRCTSYEFGLGTQMILPHRYTREDSKRKMSCYFTKFFIILL